MSHLAAGGQRPWMWPNALQGIGQPQRSAVPMEGPCPTSVQPAIPLSANPSVLSIPGHSAVDALVWPCGILLSDLPVSSLAHWKDPLHGAAKVLFQNPVSFLLKNLPKHMRLLSHCPLKKTQMHDCASQSCVSQPPSASSSLTCTPCFLLP